MSDDLPVTDEHMRAAGVARDRSAPQGERHDAAMTVAKAVAPAVAVPPREDIIKAVMQYQRLNERLSRQHPGMPRSGNTDPHGIFRHHDYLRRPAPMGFSNLRQVMQHDPILSSIIFTRIRQVSRLAKPVSYDFEAGFRIKLEGRRGKLSEGERARVRWLERYVMNCGAEFDPFKRESLRRDDFIGYLKKSTMDSLILDAMPTEVVRTRSGRIHGWVHVDGASVYLAPRDGLPDDALPPEGVDEGDLPEPWAVKAVEATGDGTTVANWYAHDELLYRVRNPRPDVYGEGYGIAEPELMMTIITGFLNVLTYNKKSYEDNHIPQGFLQIFGDFKEEDIESFKSEWSAYVAGVNNAFRLPLLVSEKGKEAGANFVKTGTDIEDMRYIKWTELLIAVQHALYGMSPEENGFESYSSQTSSLSDGSVESKIISSKDKGLYPLLQHHEANINQIVSALDEDAYFEWSGFSDPKDSWERDQRALTYGELRERQGLEPTGIKMLDEAPIDGGMQGVYLQAMGQQMQGFGGESLEGQPGDAPQGALPAPGEGEEESWPPGQGDEPLEMSEDEPEEENDESEEDDDEETPEAKRQRLKKISAELAAHLN